jgi:Zn-dependent M28 family amino/carboxypeptidase
VGLALALPLLALAWGLGLHLALGRLAPPSTGAVDNGAACVILLALAERMARGEGLPQRSRVTIALFGGEEVNMQGSRAYVRDQAPDPARTSVVNLEMMGQDGAYLQWAADGDALRLWPTDPVLRRLVDGAVQDRTGAAALVADWINSDGGSFLMAGIPAAVLGTLDRRLGLAGMHGPDDRPERITPARLAEDVALVAEIVRRFDAEG